MLDLRNLVSFFVPLVFLVGWLLALLGLIPISLPLGPIWLQGALAMTISVYFAANYCFSFSSWFYVPTHIPVYGAVMIGNLGIAGWHFRHWLRDTGWYLGGYIAPLPSSDPWSAILAVSLIYLVIFEIMKRSRYN